MKRNLVLLCGIACLAVSCKKDSVVLSKKEEAPKTITTPPPVTSIITQNAYELDLEEISPGLWKTVQPLGSIDLSFRDIHLRNGYPYGRLVLAHDAGGQYYPVTSGDDNITRIFSFFQNYCSSTVNKITISQTYNEFKAILPNGNTYVAVRDGLQTGFDFLLNQPQVADLGEIDYTVTPRTSKITRYDITMNCTNQRMITGKIIAIKKPDGSCGYRIANVGKIDAPYLPE